MTKRENLLIPLAIMVAGIFIAGAIFLSNRPKGTSGEQTTPPVLPPAPSRAEITIASDDHIRGNPEALITIVEFSDFQCPFCASFHPTLKQVMEKYPDQVRWIYRHFPLDQPPQILHPHARPAAEASECAAEQGQFWEFSDALFDNQSRLGPQLYREIASQLNLNMAQFENCVISRKYADKVQANYQEGLGLGVGGTPGSFLNGRPIPGAVPFEVLETIIQDELNQ